MAAASQRVCSCYSLHLWGKIKLNEALLDALSWNIYMDIICRSSVFVDFNMRQNKSVPIPPVCFQGSSFQVGIFILTPLL